MNEKTSVLPPQGFFGADKLYYVIQKKLFRSIFGDVFRRNVREPPEELQTYAFFIEILLFRVVEQYNIIFKTLM